MYFCTKIEELQQDMEEKKSLTLKDWADEDKPREKLLSHGKKQLTNAELIAILLRTGVPGKSAVAMAQEVLASAGNSLTALSQADAKHFRSVKGMALAKTATLMAALELGWRMQGEIAAERKTILAKSTDLFNYMLPALADLDHEEFWAVYMSNTHKVLGRQRISMGGQSDTNVDLRILFRGALEHKATLLAVAHNHPSGSLHPSNADKTLTRRIVEAGNILGIRLEEHLIVAIGLDGRADFYSFHDNGLV